ncbi:hypothetical protein BV25DRAFT_1974854 [Artomyces pyxidatus]|uniref:Uncharacterized protein n=1 Tax=Artomyces pyxidatus TaxID=48021 RepID=A0ACB8TCE8_9AGAM|nr:hypothetical protein BV25DRAFT_1974854 [Artomyces pyxidatus]
MRGLSVCLVFAGVARAAEVYLNPQVSVPSHLSTSDASSVIARHLQLEQFEPLPENGQSVIGAFDGSFVGQGARSSLLLSIDEADAKAVIPDALKPSFSLASSSPVSSFSKSISMYLDRAPHVFSHVFSQPTHNDLPSPRLLNLFSVPSSATDLFLSELSALVNFIESDADASWDSFGAFELHGLSEIAKAFGRTSAQYELAAESLRASLYGALHSDRLNLVILTYSANGLAKRSPQQSPLPPNIPPQPIGSDILCFTSAEVCSNSTSACSGRGECVAGSKAGRTCFVCSCSATKDSKGRTNHWAGTQCERKDVSGDFVLLAGTTIGLIIMVAGSISLLVTMGDMKLPSVLTGTIARDRKKD